MSTYKGYDDDVGKRATIKYIKEKQRIVDVKWKKTVFENEIEPAIKKSGKPMATFIKEAVVEKIERDGLNC